MELKYVGIYLDEVREKFWDTLYSIPNTDVKTILSLVLYLLVWCSISSIIWHGLFLIMKDYTMFQVPHYQKIHSD